MFNFFRCPVYILNNKLQDGKQQPKLLRRSSVGVYLGKSWDHASNMTLVLNLKIGHINPQYKDTEKIKLCSGL